MASLTEALSFSFSFRSHNNKFFAFSETVTKKLSGMLKTVNGRFFLSGKLPESKKYMISPMLQESHFFENSPLRAFGLKNSLLFEESFIMFNKLTGLNFNKKFFLSVNNKFSGLTSLNF